MASTASSENRRPRLPGVVLTSAVAVLAVLLATVALTTRQEPPPTVAEFAPQAVEQIRDSLPEQGDTGGRGPGSPSPTPSASASAGPGSASPSPSASPPIEVPRVRRCIGDPPRQTEDPQSPPCVPYWDGDNGGATSQGVTGNEITVAYPIDFFEDPAPVHALAEFFNRRYEFYGRRIVLQAYQPSGGGNPNPANMRADAQFVDEEVKAFASIGYASSKGSEHHYYDALAERGVISSVYRGEARGTEPIYRKHAPYEWNVLPGVDTMLATIGDFVCGSLRGFPPRHAGADQSGKPERIFGLIYHRAPDGTVPDVAPLKAALTRCGVELAAEVVDEQAADQTRSGVNTMLTMSEAGVTSVICVCDILETRRVLMPAASGQGYHPEWLVSSYIDNDVDNSFAGEAPLDQSQHVLGVTFRNKLLPRQDMPWFWALREADPAANPPSGSYYYLSSRYQQLALVAAGIQLAGPQLTPQSFERGLHQAVFPNPGAGRAPYYQAHVGFPGGRHTMIGDAAMYWYDPAAPGTVDASIPGAICYVHSGLRFSRGRWPRGEQPFYGSCR